MRDSFNTRLGFILAAAGSAIGLGNIWGFPTQVAEHGGGAFLLVYLVLVFLLALPALYAEIAIGHAAQANPVVALGQACSERSEKVGKTAGGFGLLGALMMLSFYSIVAGWMLSHALSSLFELLGATQFSEWFSSDSKARNLIMTPLFILLTASVIFQGVGEGIEKWSRRLMPALLLMLVALIIYIAMQPGAGEGFNTYLNPDFAKVMEPDLLISAMGQAFFSLSIGVGAMMVYGSYVDQKSSVGKLSLTVALLDTSIAFLAGLLIIPAIFVAKQAGVNVFSGDSFASDFQLIFNVLPALFEIMGYVGIFVSLVFFSLMSIASLTSTISSTEVPVAYLVENLAFGRKKATATVSIFVAIVSMLIIFNFDWLFGLVVNWVMKYQLPLMGLFYFLVIGWFWKRGNRLLEQSVSSSKLQFVANYMKFVCPVLMTTVFVSSL